MNLDEIKDSVCLTCMYREVEITNKPCNKCFAEAHYFEVDVELQKLILGYLENKQLATTQIDQLEYQKIHYRNKVKILGFQLERSWKILEKLESNDVK